MLPEDDVPEERFEQCRERANVRVGAERLLTALTQLEDYRLRNDERRLNISKTISVAKVSPIELVGLRNTGRLP